MTSRATPKELIGSLMPHVTSPDDTRRPVLVVVFVLLLCPPRWEAGPCDNTWFLRALLDDFILLFFSHFSTRLIPGYPPSLPTFVVSHPLIQGDVANPLYEAGRDQICLSRDELLEKPSHSIPQYDETTHQFSHEDPRNAAPRPSFAQRCILQIAGFPRCSSKLVLP